MQRKVLNIETLKEFIKKNFAYKQSGYYMYKEMRDCNFRVYFHRTPLIEESKIMGYKRQGFKLWIDMTDEEKMLVDVFPDENSTPNDLEKVYNEILPKQNKKSKETKE